MTDSAHSLPEPQLPEHQLLAEAAPQLELSANFRAQVLSECAASYALAQKIFYAKVLAGCLAAILAVTGIVSWWNHDPAMIEATSTTESTEGELSPPAAAPSLSPGTFHPEPQTQQRDAQPESVEAIQ